MNTIIDLKNSIMEMIKNDRDEKLNSSMGPIPQHIYNIFVKDSILSIIDIIVKDRNGNNVFDLEDLKQLGNDFWGVVSLVKALLLVVGTVSDVKYKNNSIEEIIFKTLTYIFIILVPVATGHIWTKQEKEDIVNISFSMYQLVASSSTARKTIRNTIKLFKSGTCICVSNEEKRQKVVSKYLPRLQSEISISVQNAREKANLSKEFTLLRKKIKMLEKNGKIEELSLVESSTITATKNATSNENMDSNINTQVESIPNTTTETTGVNIEKKNYLFDCFGGKGK